MLCLHQSQPNLWTWFIYFWKSKIAETLCIIFFSSIFMFSACQSTYRAATSFASASNQRCGEIFASKDWTHLESGNVTTSKAVSIPPWNRLLSPHVFKELARWRHTTESRRPRAIHVPRYDFIIFFGFVAGITSGFWSETSMIWIRVFVSIRLFSMLQESCY